MLVINGCEITDVVTVYGVAYTDGTSPVQEYEDLQEARYVADQLGGSVFKSTVYYSKWRGPVEEELEGVA